MSYKIESNSHATTVRKEYRSTLAAALTLARERAVTRDRLGSFEARVYEKQEEFKSLPQWELVATLRPGKGLKPFQWHERASVKKIRVEMERLQGVLNLAFNQFCEIQREQSADSALSK